MPKTERRSKWKEELGKAAQKRTEERKALQVQLDMVNRELHGLNIEQIRSDAYPALKRQQAEIIASMASL